MHFEVYLYNTKGNILNILEEIFTHLTNSSYEINTLDSLPIEYIDRRVMQFRADFINKWLSGKRENGENIVLGILNIDAYVPPLNFIFGAATPYFMTATVYLPQLKYFASPKVFEERVYKEILHEIGHLFGLKHCRIKKCVMSFSNSIYDVDRKTGKFCIKHYKELLRNGLRPDESLILR